MVLPLGNDVDVVRARQTAVRLADAVGLPQQARARLDLVVAELASNVVRHVGKGRITLEVMHPETAAGATGIRIVCVDAGAGAEAQAPGRPGAARGLGLGLAVARELADTLALTSTPRMGTRVEAVVRG